MITFCYRFGFHDAQKGASFICAVKMKVLIPTSLLHFWQAIDFEVEFSLKKSHWLLKPLCVQCETMTCSTEHD